MSDIVVRFAPSPTGYLHIGGARTALFNYLFARNAGGKFLLRIEDTDIERSTPEAVKAILAGLNWLGLEHDGDTIYQLSRRERHAEIAYELIRRGRAYRCYATKEELEEMREYQKANNLQQRYDCRWRDKDSSEAPKDANYVVRLKAPQTGETIIKDLVQGEISVANNQLDDMVLLRSDGIPTYMLAVVVDDFDMNITHIVRGDDHLTNAFRQKQIYDAMDWKTPEFAHIPLIFGEDGTKLSKRHGAISVETYQDLGYLPEAMINYLLRLGWSHGNDEIITKEDAIKWFNLESISKSPARFDFKKLDSLNSHYIKQADNTRLYSLIKDDIIKNCGDKLSSFSEERIMKAMPILKDRSKTMIEFLDNAIIFASCGIVKFDDDAKEYVASLKVNLIKIYELLTNFPEEFWEKKAIHDAIKELATNNSDSLGNFGGPLRSALSGKKNAASAFDIAACIGKAETLTRIKMVI